MRNGKNKKRKGYFSSLHWAHWLIIALSLLLTFSAWLFSQKQVAEKKQLLFSKDANQVIELVQERMTHYEDALWAGVAMIQANGGQVDYPRWKAYVESLNLLTRYPGINGLGVIISVYPHQLEKYLSNQRELREKFYIHPTHTQQRYLPITYIVPVKGNEQAVGLDIAHEDNRFKAALKAEITGKAQITGPITLVQDAKKTPGFLFYAPYYKDGMYQTEQARKEHFKGLVYAPFIVSKLMDGVLSQTNRRVVIRISDGDQSIYNELTPSNAHYTSDAGFKMQRSVEMFGRHWLYEIESSKSFDSATKDSQPLTILACGIVIDTLIVFLFITLSRSNRKAFAYAEQMNRDLKEKSRNLERSNKNLLEAQQRVNKLINFDPLTGLPNRQSFINYLENTLADNPGYLAVCMLDIDNFKAVNDNYGHSVGDHLLRKVAKAFVEQIDTNCFLAHFGGDNLALIIKGISGPESATRKVKALTNLLKGKIEVAQYQLSVTMSVGVAMYLRSGESASQLLKSADVAMYKAKNQGRNAVTFSDEKTNESFRRRNEIERLLTTAIENEELYLNYQPQICARTGRIFAVEALIRWNSSEIGLVGPAEFIPIAEEIGLINEIGLFAMRQVNRDLDELQKVMKSLKVSINVSIKQLERPGFLSQVARSLSKDKLESGCLSFEVTETAVMKDPETVVDIMVRLSEMNVSFSLDDFGTGYSSMSYLKTLPISYLKIDQSFVRDIEGDKSDRAIIRSIIQLSHSLGARAIAEGVETQQQADFLINSGCDYLQGYYYDKPISLSDLLRKYAS